MSDSWPGMCGACEAGRCWSCSGVTMEGFGCECAEENHYDNLDPDGDIDDFDHEDLEAGTQ